MVLTERDAELLARVADEGGLPAQLLVDLAHLEDDIPDLNLHGAKAELSRRVADVLNSYADPERSA